MIILLLILYAPLFLKAFFSLPFFDRPNSSAKLLLGKIEYLLSAWRDLPLAFFLLGVGCFLWIKEGFQGTTFLLFTLFLFSQFNRISTKNFRYNLCRNLLKRDLIDPLLFFGFYYRGLASFRPDFTHFATLAGPLEDYRTGRKPRKSFWAVLRVCLDTATLARLAMFAMQSFPQERGQELFDWLARFWGSFFLARFHLALKTIGIENWKPIPGKLLLVFNHKSYLDFALNFFALRNLSIHQRHLRPRFIAAKNHFIDNPFLYSWVGVGKCIQKAGMIFINRKRGRGWLAMKQAAELLLQSDLEIAVYPNGTRARARINELGERLDSGYYTTFNPHQLREERGHLKIGLAQLILDAAIQLRARKEPPLHVLFVGIDGTGIASPRGSILIQKEAEVSFRVGECWPVELPSDLPLENPQGNPVTNEAQDHYMRLLKTLHAQIDEKLVCALGHHEKLMRWALDDSSFLAPEQRKLLEDFLKSSDAAHEILPFVVLDRIYTLHPSRWKAHLRAFADALLHRQGEFALRRIQEEVSLESLKYGNRLQGARQKIGYKQKTA